MITGAHSFPDEHHIDTDIAIVGAGAAGITLAMELRGSGHRVTLFESGNRGLEDETQDLYRGETRGFPTLPLDASRLRMFGGTTNHWTGLCLELDDVDFEQRDGLPYTGWPISKSELRPFYDRARAYVEINPDDPHNLQRWVDFAGARPLAFDPSKWRHVVMNESPPTAFGSAYEADLEAAANIDVVLDANLLEIEVNESANRVTGLRFACIDGPRFTASARHYVLAAGGIEIPRLLLLSNSVQTEGLGNGNDLVGRFFMDHNTLRPTMMTLVPNGAPDLSLYTRRHYDSPYAASIMLAGSQDLIRREGLGNFRAHIYDTRRPSPGVQAAGSLMHAAGAGAVPEDIGRHLADAFTDLDDISNEVLKRLLGTETGPLDRHWIEVWVGFEQFPNPDSRIMLSDERDRFGQRRVICDWRLGEGELRTAHRAAQLLAEEFGRLGVGRTWSELLWTPGQWTNSVPGKHHTGTTRMSSNPADGVVNTDCRMHTVHNLYIASSSVFPTEGQAAPTQTIVALAIRLADRLKATQPP